MLAGCGESSGTAGGGAPSESRSPAYIYVANEVRVGSRWTSSVNVYSALLSGNIAPVSVISGSYTQLTQVNGIVVNADGEIFVVDTDTNEIVGFPPGSSGNVSPNVVIGGGNTDLSWPIGLALDGKGDLYVANCGSDCNGGSLLPSVLEFSAGSNGDVAPIRDVSGSETQLAHANAIALDGEGNIYVSNISGGNSIDVFDSTANGNASPSRVISGPETLLDGPLGIAVDRHGIYADSDYASFIERFALDANGNVAPVSAVSGPRTRLAGPDGITVDDAGAVYATSDRRVLKFVALAHGDERPVAKIEGANTGLSGAVFLFVK
jgi:sugar lactone lactonase YvrE